MSKIKVCAVTGHRSLPPDKIDFVRKRLEEEVEKAIEEGYNWFLSGMAPGTDLIFANVVADLRDRKQRDIKLEAVLPHAGWIEKKDRLFQSALARTDAHRIICNEYVPSCFMQRNRAMADDALLVIGVTDGRSSGGTCFTLDYATNRSKEIRLIRI